MFSKKPVIFFFLLPQLTQRWDSWLDSSAQIWLINLLRAMKIQATVTLVLCFVFFSLCLFFVLLTSQTSITAPTFLSAEAFFLLRKSIDFKCCWSRSSPSFSPTESSRGGSGVRSAWMTYQGRKEPLHTCSFLKSPAFSTFSTRTLDSSGLSFIK